MVMSTSGLWCASLARIMAIRSCTLAAPGGCCACLNSLGMNGLWVMPSMVTSCAMVGVLPV